MHSELLRRCPAFAGTSRTVPHSGFSATKRPLSQPSMEFADTPASYDLQGRFGSSFTMLAQQRPASPPGLTFGNRSVPAGGAASGGATTISSGAAGKSASMRHNQSRPGSPGSFDPISGLPNSSAFLSVARGGPQALRTDIGSAARAASKGAQGGGQVLNNVIFQMMQAPGSVPFLAKMEHLPFWLMCIWFVEQRRSELFLFLLRLHTSLSKQGILILCTHHSNNTSSSPLPSCLSRRPRSTSSREAAPCVPTAMAIHAPSGLCATSAPTKGEEAW